MSISYYTDYTHEVSLWLMVIPSYGPQLFFCNDLSGSVAQNLRFFYRLLQVVRLMVMRRRTRTRTRMRMMPAMTIHRWFYWSMILSDSHFSVYMINIHINIYICIPICRMARPHPSMNSPSYSAPQSWSCSTGFPPLRSAAIHSRAPWRLVLCSQRFFDGSRWMRD